MTKPPPELKDWSKNNLIREVNRLRAILREHAERPGDDPREQAANEPIIDVAGDPLATGGALLDMRSAVLMDEMNVVLVDTKSSEPVAMMMSLKGRINYAAERVEHAYLFGPDGAATLVSELIGLVSRADRVGQQHGQRFALEFKNEFDQRMNRMP
jgi:hypothetical protein